MPNLVLHWITRPHFNIHRAQSHSYDSNVVRLRERVRLRSGKHKLSTHALTMLIGHKVTSQGLSDYTQLTFSRDGSKKNYVGEKKLDAMSKHGDKAL